MKFNKNFQFFFGGANLVGVRITAKMPYGSFTSFCKMGSAKAAVFPLPYNNKIKKTRQKTQDGETKVNQSLS